MFALFSVKMKFNRILFAGTDFSREETDERKNVNEDESVEKRYQVRWKRRSVSISSFPAGLVNCIKKLKQTKVEEGR